MAAGSPFFARIKGDILRIVAAVPPGHIVGYAAIAAHLEVSARQVAYVLAMLDEGEQCAVPWHRAVPQNGFVSATNPVRAARQIALLGEDGVSIGPGGRIADAATFMVNDDFLTTVMPAQMRPANAPAAVRRPRSRSPRVR